MALAFTIKQRNRTGNQKRHTVDIAFDSSYPTGGEAATAANFGLTVVNDVVFPEPSGGYIFQYDRTNAKILVYAAGGQPAHTHDFKIIAGQAAASTDAISAKTLTLGKESATNITIAGANSATLGGVVATAATVAAASEVADTTDLSALTAVRAIATGR